jgi:myo-inositol 2-dehydrogenase/D-chiro-inositol 1-dehydrogenase
VTVRVGLIGAGIMGADHARILATEVPGARLQYLCDADGTRARKVADETGAQNAVTDPLAVIAAKDVDAVLVASPDTTHGPLTMAAIAAGKPVLCEKPMAPTAAECLTVLDAEVKGGRRLVQIGFMRRFDPAYADMKRAHDGGSLGPAYMFHCIHRNVAVPDWFTSDMAITNSLPHEFDIARWLLDTEYRTISVFQPKNVDAKRLVTPVFVVIETMAGQLVNIEMNNAAVYGYDVRGELVCDKGTVALRSPARSETNFGLVRGERYPADWRPWFADAYRLQDQAWVRSISTGQPVGASAWDGYVATAVAEAGVRARTSGKAESVTLAAKPGLYG